MHKEKKRQKRGYPGLTQGVFSRVRVACQRHQYHYYNYFQFQFNWPSIPELLRLSEPSLPKWEILARTGAGFSGTYHPKSVRAHRAEGNLSVQWFHPLLTHRLLRKRQPLTYCWLAHGRQCQQYQQTEIKQLVYYYCFVVKCLY